MTTERSFSKMMEMMLNERLTVFKGKTLNRGTLMELYTTIFNLVSDIFVQSKVQLSNEAVNLVAQLYYEDININHRQGVDEQIYTQRAKFENIPNHELVIMTKLWKDHPYGQLFVQVLKKRS
jgi:hypothetical protein